MSRNRKKSLPPRNREPDRQEKAVSKAVAQPHSRQAAPARSRFAVAAVCVFLLLAILLVYGQTARHSFLNYDDPAYVSENTVVQNGLTWKGVAWSFTTFEGANWHPVTWLSHMLDCQLFGMRSGRHHGMNVAFHIVNSILLYLLLLRLTAAFWPSAVVAALFALHPLHVESVAWVAERKDVLSTMFGLLAIHAYVGYVRRPAALRYVLVAVLFLLGVMSKPMLVTLPFVLLLLDYWPLGRWIVPPPGVLRYQNAGSSGGIAAWLALEKVPLLVLAAASSAITYIAQQQKGAMALLGSDISFPVRLANALVSYVEYLGKAAWPSPLIVFYPYVPHRPLWQPVAAAVFLVAVTGVAVRLWRSRPYLAVGWFWYLGMLVPVIGLVQVGAQSMADRYTYLPLVGIFILTVWGSADLLANRRFGRESLAVLAAAAILACTVLTARQAARWTDTLSLFEYALTIMPDNAAAHRNLGDVLLQQNRNEEAEVHFRALAQIDSPGRAMAECNWATTLSNRKRFAEAADHLRKALQINPDLAIAHNGLALALAELGVFQETIEQFQEAVRLLPEKPEALKNLAWALATCPDRKLRDGTKAVELAERAVALCETRQPEFLDTLAAAYAEAGRYSEAARTADEAVGLARQQKKSALAESIRAKRSLYEVETPAGSAPRMPAVRP
jgi:protein O-mannosyl-transferase